MTKSNLYDNLQIDIQKIHSAAIQNSYFITKGNVYLTGILMKTNLWKKLIDSGFVRNWFNEFHTYWKEVLGGRPLYFHDFFYLYSDYRKKFQNIGLDDTSENFLETWQSPENIYLLFSAVYKYTLCPMPFYPFRKYIISANKILEYGCGIAPITYSAVKYGRFSMGKFTIADIQSYTYHFAKWRLYNMKNVRMVNINPHELPKFEQGYDLIFLMTVLEHLPNPLEVLNNLYESLTIGGHLIFDFILGEGKGLDTKQAILGRVKIINFINEKFVIESGKIEVDKSISTTIAKKR
ncbi:MAG: Methyltransferase type 12 [Candidatus Brocadiaceae bacterium]|nr:Methyltransferase type 12 [Candidatus Brocadiaceae bacterium]